MSESGTYVCRQCKKDIRTQLIKCVPCDKKFHPSCHKLHKVYNAANELITCPGKWEIFTIKESSAAKERTMSQTEENQTGGDSMEMKMDWLVRKIRNEMVNKNEIKNVIREIVKDETENLRREMEEMKKMMGNFKVVIDELQNVLNADKGMGEVKKSYSGAVKRSQRESVLVIKPKVGEENKSSEETKRDIKGIDISKMGVGITKIKKVTRGAVVVGCEDGTQAEKLKQKVVKDLGEKYDIQVPKKRKPKIKIFDVDNEDCENEHSFWEKIMEQNGLQKNTIEGKIIRKVAKANSKRTVVIAEVNIVTREKFLQLEKLKVGWNICRVQEYIGILRCYKCCGYYHFAKDCVKKETCGNCTKQHATKECDSDIRKCVNCEEKIKNYKIKSLDSNHSAYDRNCPCLKKEMEKQREKLQCSNI